MAEPGLQRPRVVAGVSQGISVVWLAARDIPRTREAVEAAFDRRRASQLRALLHTSPRPSSTLLPQAPAAEQRSIKSQTCRGLAGKNRLRCGRQ